MPRRPEDRPPGWLLGATAPFWLAVAGVVVGSPAEWVSGVAAGRMGAVVSVVVVFGAAWIIGMGCLLVWVRSVAVAVGTQQHARRASDLIKVGVALLLIQVGTLAVLSGSHAGGVQVSVTEVVVLAGLAGSAVGLVIWALSLARLLFGLRRNLRGLPDPANT